MHKKQNDVKDKESKKDKEMNLHLWTCDECMWSACVHVWVYVCVPAYAAQIEFFPLSAILKNELILSLIEFVLHRRLFSSPPQRENRKG